METPTNNLFFDWLRNNIIVILVTATSVIIAYTRLDAQVQALDARGQERAIQRERQIGELTAQLEIVKSSYITRTELNAAVVSRLDRIENKLDEAIQKK